MQYDYQESSGNVANKLDALAAGRDSRRPGRGFQGRRENPLLAVVQGNQQVVKLPFASQFVITVNGQPEAEPTSLKRGDRVEVTHDSYISKVVAQRTLAAGGVVEQIDYTARTVNVKDDSGQKVTYQAGTQCKITLGDETVVLDVLRGGDRVKIEHAEIDPKGEKVISATAIAAERPTDASRWALIIAVQNYDDKLLSPLPYSLADAALLAETFAKRYRIPAEQVRVFNDPSAVILQRELPEFLKSVGADGRLIVYFIGHAMKDASGQVFLAPKDFRSDQPTANGQPLQWLVDLVEDCPAKEKLLFLDGSHAGSGAEQAGERSSAEMIRALKPKPNRALLLKTIAVASCQKGQHGLDLAAKAHGLFAWCLAEGYGGGADVKRDTVVEPTELFAFLQKAMPAAGAEGTQTPEVFLPDDRPARLSEAAKASIRKLAGYVDQLKINLDEVSQEYDVALQASGAEPEPRLLFGLVLLKAKRDPKNPNKAALHFEAVRAELPNQPLPYAALAWQKLEKRTFPWLAIHELTNMINKIPKPASPDQASPPLTPDPYEWAGQLRDYAVGVNDPSRQLTEAVAALDAAVALHGAQAVALYGKGRQHSADILADFDKKIGDATDEADIGTLKVKRRLLPNYAEFPISQYKDQVIAHLDD